MLTVESHSSKVADLKLATVIQKQLEHLLLPFHYRAVAQSLDISHGKVFSEEEAFIAHATPKRVREFLAGRACAHKAIEQMGYTSRPLLAPKKGVLNWPHHLVGSITHSNVIAAAIVAKRSWCPSIGIDAEEEDRLKPELWPLTLNAAEREWLQQVSAQEQLIWATLIFSAKECFYKYQYPITREWLGFHDVDIVVNSSYGTFTVQVHLPDHAAGSLAQIARGYFFMAQGHVVTVII